MLHVAAARSVSEFQVRKASLGGMRARDTSTLVRYLIDRSRLDIGGPH
jgi:hypothetical protein